MGQALPLCGHLGAARSRQDESKEVGEVGSKRTSSGCNGVHHVWWGGLISRLLRSLPRPDRVWPNQRTPAPQRRSAWPSSGRETKRVAAARMAGCYRNPHLLLRPIIYNPFARQVPTKRSHIDRAHSSYNIIQLLISN
jgi:hypothetical protein